MESAPAGGGSRLVWLSVKLLSLVGTAFLGLAASAPGAWATPFDFTFTGSLVTFTVPTTDTYQILAFGAQGGSSFVPGSNGGLGAEIGGNFSLTAGETLEIAVGRMGGTARVAVAAVAAAAASWSAPATHRWSLPAAVAAAAPSVFPA